MKTLREILNYVAKDYGYENYALLLDSYRKDIIDNYLYDCFIAVQRQAQHKINKRVEDDYLNDNFDTTSVINDNNLIR